MRDGDTLQGVAAALWGDAALWYVLAEANGLNAASSLTAGQSLIIPNKVANLHNNATTFRPYDPNKAIGDVQPGAPKPPAAAGKKGCGALGAILLVIVAVAITVLSHGALTHAALTIGSSAPGALVPLATIAGTGGVLAGGGVVAGIAAGALSAVAGAVASQLVGLALGIQDKFSFKNIALAAISGGIGGGLGNISLLGKTAGAFANGAARGVLSNALQQGVAVATGLQKNFDWAGVAVGGVVGGVSGALDARFNSAKYTAPARSIESYGQQALTGAAAAIAGGATRSLLTGSDFGDNVLAALPDVIGSTIGNLVVRGVSFKSSKNFDVNFNSFVRFPSKTTGTQKNQRRPRVESRMILAMCHC